MSISVLLIEAGVTLDGPLLHELVRRKDSFNEIGILVSDEQKASKYVWVSRGGQGNSRIVPCASSYKG